MATDLALISSKGTLPFIWHEDSLWCRNVVIARVVEGSDKHGLLWRAYIGVHDEPTGPIFFARPHAQQFIEKFFLLE